MTSKTPTLLTFTHRGEDEANLNKDELTSIYALLSYVAYQQNIGEQAVREIVMTQFQVDDVTQLPRKSYKEVIQFLVDMKADLILN